MRSQKTASPLSWTANLKSCSSSYRVGKVRAAVICCAGFYSFSVSSVKKIDISGDRATAGCSNLKLKQVGRWVVTSSVVATGVLQLHRLYLSSAGVGVFLRAADAPLTAWLWQKRGRFASCCVGVRVVL